MGERSTLPHEHLRKKNINSFIITTFCNGLEPFTKLMSDCIMDNGALQEEEAIGIPFRNQPHIEVVHNKNIYTTLVPNL
jgi:hypothetical protein